MSPYNLEHDVIDIHASEPVEEPGFLRRYLFRGKHMLAYYSQMQPGVDSTALPEHYRQHANEEIIFVLQGRLEYEDGRVVEAGQVTINHPMQLHGCKVTSREPAIAFCVHAPPPARFDQPEMIKNFLGFHHKKQPPAAPEL